MDLREQYPRSPKETLAGLIFLPRMIDKARAHKRETLGEYVFPCPMDKLLLKLLDASEEDFADRAADENDASIGEWAEKILRSRSPEEIDRTNRTLLEKKPDTEEKKKRFIELRNGIDASREDITTWIELMDLEEGRAVPR